MLWWSPQPPFSAIAENVFLLNLLWPTKRGPVMAVTNIQLLQIAQILNVCWWQAVVFSHAAEHIANMPGCCVIHGASLCTQCSRNTCCMLSCCFSFLFPLFVPSFPCNSQAPQQIKTPLIWLKTALSLSNTYKVSVSITIWCFKAKKDSWCQVLQ